MPITTKVNPYANVKQFSDQDTLAISSSGNSSVGAKNYLASMVTSLSGGALNTGNGNFELLSTIGWSLAHSSISGTIPLPTSVASSNAAFSATSGGSSAAGTLSFNVVSGGTQLAGAASASLVSSAASTAGDMVISLPFFIDAEDRTKVLTFNFYYSVISGATGLNFSGTSSNSFAVFFYDLANNTWIQPAGVYNLVQSSGNGFCTGTFQAPSNATQFQIALVAISGSTAAYTMLVDDFVVGPQAMPNGTIITDWVAYTPTLTGFGTATNVNGKSRRVGDSLEVEGNLTVGTPTGVSTAITLGYNGGNGNVFIDTAKQVPNAVVGVAAYNQSSSTYFGSYVIATTGTNNFVGLSQQSSTTNNLATPVAGTNFAAGSVIQYKFSVPIVGWSSNTVMSNDTDTRVVAMRTIPVGGTLTTTSAASITFGTATLDTHGAFNSSTGTYTVPVAGIYRVSGQLGGGASGTYGVTVNVAKNATPQAPSFIVGPNSTNSTMCNFDFIGSFISGDLITIFANVTTGSQSVATNGTLNIQRVSGPAVVAATESVNAHYNTSAGQSIPTAAVTQIVFGTKTYDTHNAMNTSTGSYTCPVSGKYRISGNIRYANGQSFTAGGYAATFAYKNGAEVEHVDLPIYVTGTMGTGPSASVSTTVQCNAGDVLAIFSSHAETTARTLQGSVLTLNYIVIERVGN